MSASTLLPAITILLYFVWVAMSGEWTIPWAPIAKIVEAAKVVILLHEPQRTLPALLQFAGIRKLTLKPLPFYS